MARITPCRALISDRFPVASFVVEVPPDRAFEVACATDPHLFHASQAKRRATSNFCTSRMGGLMRAPAGQATYIVPPDQLKRFAGATRLYYALGTYGSARGDDPRFSIAFERLPETPWIQIAPDFTGRALDRGRAGRSAPASPRYGAAPVSLTWGGDATVSGPPDPKQTPARLGRVADYDDGFDAGLWTRSLDAPSADAPSGSDSAAEADDAGGPARNSAADMTGGDAGYEDGGDRPDGEAWAASPGDDAAGEFDGEGGQRDGGEEEPVGVASPDAGDRYDAGEHDAGDAGTGDRYDGGRDAGVPEAGTPDAGAQTGDAGAGARTCTLLPVIGIERTSAEFKKKVCEIGGRLQIDPNHLMAMMSHETGGKFTPSVPNAKGSGATGLIQFMPDTAKRLGTTVEELARMTAEEQLDYVEKFFAPYKGRLKTMEDLYVAGLWPVAIGKPGDTILFSRPSKVYEQNAGLDVDKDGHVKKAEAATGVTRILETAQRAVASGTAAPHTVALGMSAARRSPGRAAYEDAPDIWRPRGTNTAPSGTRAARAPAPRFGAASAAAARPRLTRPATPRRARALVDTPDLSRDATDDVGTPPTAVEPAPVPCGRFSEYSDFGVRNAPLPAESLRARVFSAPQVLAATDRLRIIDIVARFEGGEAGYSAVNADGEFRDPGLPQYQATHVGLSWGFVQFAQRYGVLGAVLTACQRRDPAAFATAFGPQAEDLLRVTNAETEEGRLQPVAGGLLWETPWPERFQKAGEVAAFQAAQREVADQHFLVPNLSIAAGLGFVTDRALAVLYDRCVHMGNGTGAHFVVETVGPIRSQQQLQASLTALGHADVGAFQRGAGLEASGLWDSRTHAALTGALRSLGAASPVAVPALEAMLDSLVSAARDRAKTGDKTWTTIARRLSTLRTTTDLGDVAYQLA